MKIGPISHFCHHLLLSFLEEKVGSGGDVTLSWGKTCQSLGMMRFCSQLNSSKLTFLPMAKCSCVCGKTEQLFRPGGGKKCLTAEILGPNSPVVLLVEELHCRTGATTCRVRSAAGVGQERGGNVERKALTQGTLSLFILQPQLSLPPTSFHTSLLQSSEFGLPHFRIPRVPFLAHRCS